MTQTSVLFGLDLSGGLQTYLSSVSGRVPLLLYVVTWLCKPNSHYSERRQLYTDPIMKSLGFVKPVLNWANVCSPDHAPDTSTNYGSFLN